MKQLIHCIKCNAIIMGFKYVMLPGDRITEYMIDQTVGQAPWLKGMDMVCQKCNTPFSMEQMDNAGQKPS